MKLRFSKYDKLWSKQVRERDRQCLYCGRVNGLNAHHVERRGVKATRLLLENGVTLCASCHTFSHTFSAHKTPEAFRRWFKREYPQRYKIIKARLQIHMTEKQAIDEYLKKDVLNYIKVLKKLS